MRPPHIPSLTPLRGIAALWVVLFHIDVCIYYRELGSLLPKDNSGLIAKGYLWVDFFFVLSGFVIAHVYETALLKRRPLKTYQHFIWSRFTRIYPLHAFTLLALVSFALFVPLLFPTMLDGSWYNYFNVDTFASELFLFNAMGAHPYLSWNIVSWSIGAEWWTYILAIAFIFALSKTSTITSIFFAIFAWLALGHFSFTYSALNLDMTYDFGFARCLCEFFIGLVAYRCYRERLCIGLFSHDLFFLVLSSALVLGFHLNTIDIAFVPVFTLLVLAASHNRGLPHSLLQHPIAVYLGNISYSIYMVHGLIFHIFWYGLPYANDHYGFGTLNIWQKIVFVSTFFALTLLISHFTHLTIERKFRFWLQRRWSY